MSSSPWALSYLWGNMRCPLEKQTSGRARLYRSEKNGTVCVILPVHCKSQVIIIVVSDFVVNRFWHGPSRWSFSDSSWLMFLVWSPSQNWDSAILMSGVMAWYGSVSSSTTAMLLSAMWTTTDLPWLGFLRVPHCSSVMSFLGGLASWTLVVTALLKFLSLSASPVLTSDETLVSITWLRC